MANLGSIIGLAHPGFVEEVFSAASGAWLINVTRSSKRIEQLLKEMAKLGKFECLSA